jgi:hypothetical protein
MASDPRTGKRLYRSIALRIGRPLGRRRRHAPSRGARVVVPPSREWAGTPPTQHWLSAPPWSAGGCGTPTACRPGPAQSAGLRVEVTWDADGNDAENPNGEWFDVINPSAQDVALGGWWVRDSHPAPLHLPGRRGGRRRPPRAGARRPRDGHRGALLLGPAGPAFENAGTTPGMGDGGYLFDPHGDLRAWDVYPCRVAC